MQSKITNKVLSGILFVSLLLQMAMPVAYAAESNPTQETKTITAFADLVEDVKTITVPVGTAEIEIITSLPKTVTATVKSTVYEETEPKTENVNLDVTWENDKPLSSNIPDTFTYTAKLTDVSCTLAEGVALPQIKVQIEDCLNSAEGLDTTVDQATGALEAPAEPFTAYAAARLLKGSNITPTVDVSGESIYANGTPITIEAGTLNVGVRNTKIKYNNGTSEVYLDLNPNQDGIQQETDLSGYKIYGGSESSQVENTSITMTGGKVTNIYGGGESSDVSGDTHINISGTAEVSGNVYGGGYGGGHKVQGTAYITITGGDISQEHCGMIVGGGAEWCDVGHAEIKITGGAVNQVMAKADPGGGSVTGNKTALVTVPVWVNDREFTNALYKKDTQWIVKGNVTLTDDTKITIAENETMIVSDGSTLTTNGKLINNGTIIKKGTISGDVSGTGSIVLTPLVDNLNKAVYANGIPITILKGDKDNESKISYGEGLYVDFGGASSVDLSEYSIYGGSDTEEKLNSNIKMSGGSVKNLYGAGKGFNVKNATIQITGGTVSGTLEGGGEDSIDNGYIGVFSNALKPETFDNLYYKEAELKWKIKGEYTIPEEDTFYYLESDETLEIPENAVLIIKGELTNKGKIINNGKIIGTAGGIIEGTGVIITEPVINKSEKVIYANGAPILIEKGSDSEHLRIKYHDGTGYVDLKMEGSEDLLIQDYTINGGAAGGEVRKTSITVNGGNIKRIECGNAAESVDIIVTGDVIMPTDRGNISCNTNENAVSSLFVYYEGANPNCIPYPIIDNSSYGFKNIFCYYPNMPLTEGWQPEIIQGKAVIPKEYTVEIPTGKEMTIPKASTLTIEGTLTNNGSLLVEGNISKESTGTLQGLGIFKTTIFTANDIQAIPDQLYTGNAIMPTVTVNSSRTFMGKAFTVDTAGYTKSYDNNTNVGTAKVVFAHTNGTAVEKTFNIVKSGTTFEGGIKTYKAEEATNTFTYGDTITVKVTPTATGTAPVTKGLQATRSFSAPTANQMALFVGEKQITEPVNAIDGVYTMTYDTTGKDIVIGANTTTAKYVGNSNMADYSENVTVTLNKKAISSAEVETSDASASREYNGTASFAGVVLILNSSDILSGDTVRATASGTVTNANVGTDKAFTATSVTLDGNHKDYYSLVATDVSGNVSITQASAAGVNQELQVVKDLEKDYTFDLTKLLPALSEGKGFGDITYIVGSVTNAESVLTQTPVNEDIVNGKITLTVANVTEKDKTAIIQIKVSSKNYKDFTADLTVKTIDKTPLTVEAEFTGGTYNGNPYAYIGAPTFKNGTDAVTGITYTAKYVGRDGTTYAESETAPSQAGKYNLLLTVSGESANTYAGTTAIDFEITKKQITAKPTDASIESNASFPAYTWSVETGIEGEIITASNAESVVMEAQENGTKLEPVKVGTFDIVFTTAPVFNQSGDTEKNYAIQIGTGKLAVTKHNSSGGSPGGGGGSSSNVKENSSITITIPPATKDHPNRPTQATITETSTITNGTANVTVSASTIADAISKAQAEAKQKGREKNGIVLEIKADTPNSPASSIFANLPRAAVDALVNAEVNEVCINSGVAEINVDLETLKTIQKEISADVNVSAKKVDNSTLSAEAKAVVGDRPVFELSITGANGTKVTDFGKGQVSVSIPYTLGANEKAENVTAYYIDNAGKVQEIPNCVYDEKTQTVTFVTNHFSKYAIGYKEDTTTTVTTTAFTDIENHWAKKNIEFVTAQGLFSGTGDGKFSPDVSMTRGMFMTVLGRLAEADVSSCKTTKFTDVKADSYYLPYVEWASKSGIVKGVSETSFAPDQSITREQMAVIMSNYAKVTGFELPQVHAEITFADNAEIAGFAKTAVKQMQRAGILSGKNGNLFDPQGTATRAEVSAVLKRFVELTEKQ